MTTPGSSGKAGPTPIPYVGEQVRPSFHVGTQEIRLGDRVVGIHRSHKHQVSGTVVMAYGEPCLSTKEGVFPLDRIAVLEVQPPLFE